MLKGFEDITYELTKEEMEKLPIVIKGLEKKIGKEPLQAQRYVKL